MAYKKQSDFKNKHLEIIIESKLIVRPAISGVPEAVVAAGAAVHTVIKKVKRSNRWNGKETVDGIVVR